jgi:hypothetical protein
MKRLFFIGVLVLCAAVGEAMACTCGDSTVKDDFNSAEVVFLGEVIKTEKIKITRNGQDDWELKAILKVERAWKGEVFEEMAVRTFSAPEGSMALCGTPFETGTKWIIFSANEFTDVCAGTGDFPYAETVIKELGKGWKPKHENAPSKGAG